VAVEDVDIYGRLVGTVFVNDSNINLAMVEQGHAWWYEQYARDAFELELAEQQARAARRGLWASGTAVEPWEWRRR
jgi:endonuclease YncB( thermonuclease family)